MAGHYPVINYVNIMDIFINALGEWVKHNIDFPAVVMILILMLGLWVLIKTQRDPNNNFNFEDMLRDDVGKPSAYRLAIFVSLAVSTWVLMYMVIATKGTIDPWIFAWYVAVWSGAKVAEKGIEAYANRGNNNRQPNYSPIPNSYDDEPPGGLNQQLPSEYSSSRGQPYQ